MNSKNSRDITLYDVVMKATDLQSKAEKIEWLQKHNHPVLRNILLVMYDPKRFPLLIPNTEPPYTPTKGIDNAKFLLKEGRKLKYFVKGMGSDQMNQIRREGVFIDMLETVHPDDAKLLLLMIKQKPIKGLTVKTINGAFGNIIPETE